MSASPTLRRVVLNAATVLLVVGAGAYVVALILEGTKNPEASQVGVFIAVAALGLAVLGFIAWVAASFFAWIGRTVANDWAEPAKAAQPVELTEEPTEDPVDTNVANEFIDLGTRFKTLARRRRELWRERPVNVKATLEIEQEMADAHRSSYNGHKNNGKAAVMDPVHGSTTNVPVDLLSEHSLPYLERLDFLTRHLRRLCQRAHSCGSSPTELFLVFQERGCVLQRRPGDGSSRLHWRQQASGHDAGDCGGGDPHRRGLSQSRSGSSQSRCSVHPPSSSSTVRSDT